MVFSVHKDSSEHFFCQRIQPRTDSKLTILKTVAVIVAETAMIELL